MRWVVVASEGFEKRGFPRAIAAYKTYLVTRHNSKRRVLDNGLAAYFNGDGIDLKHLSSVAPLRGSNNHHSHMYKETTYAGGGGGAADVDGDVDGDGATVGSVVAGAGTVVATEVTAPMVVVAAGLTPVVVGPTRLD